MRWVSWVSVSSALGFIISTISKFAVVSDALPHTKGCSDQSDCGADAKAKPLFVYFWFWAQHQHLRQIFFSWADLLRAACTRNKLCCTIYIILVIFVIAWIILVHLNSNCSACCAIWLEQKIHNGWKFPCWILHFKHSSRTAWYCRWICLLGTAMFLYPTMYLSIIVESVFMFRLGFWGVRCFTRLASAAMK